MNERLLPRKKVIKALEKFEAGEDIRKICHQHNISQETLYQWHQQYNEIEIKLMKELKRLSKENKQLNRRNAKLMDDLEQLKELFETIPARSGNLLFAQ